MRVGYCILHTPELEVDISSKNLALTFKEKLIYCNELPLIFYTCCSYALYNVGFSMTRNLGEIT